MDHLTWEWEGPTLAEQVLLLSIEQSRATYQGQVEKVKEIGEQMIDIVRGVVRDDTGDVQH